MPEIDISKLKPAELIFCNAILQGLNQTQAVYQAYPLVKSNTYARKKASELVTKSNIKDYIEANKQLLQTKSGENTDTLIQKAQDLYKKADISNNYSGMAKAIELIAKLTGSFTAERPNPEQAKLKAESKAKQAEMVNMLNEAINRKYNHVIVDSTVVQEQPAGGLTVDSGHERPEVAILQPESEQCPEKAYPQPPNAPDHQDIILPSDNAAIFGV